MTRALDTDPRADSDGGAPAFFREISTTAAPSRVRAVLLAVALCTLAAQAFSLVLGFQLDDYTLLAAPWSLFALGASGSELHGDIFAVRFSIWFVWGLLDVLPGAPAELAHRAVGLLAHTAAAVLIARVLLRAHGGTAAALFAGLLFGVGSGAASSV